MKILLYHLFPEMESHSLPLMLSILPTAERRSNAKEIETGTGVVVVATILGTGTETETGTGTGTGIEIVVIVIAPEGQMTITTINHGGGSMNETTITNIEAMISMPNLDGMKMSIVLGIVIVKSAIGIGNPDETGTGTGTETETETETEETETEGAETEEIGTETEETGKGKGNEETGIGETGIKETETEETGKGNEGTGTDTEETERKTERNPINHKPRPLVKARFLLRQQLVTLLDPNSKKCLLLTLTATVFYLHLQKQAKALDLVLLADYALFFFRQILVRAF